MTQWTVPADVVRVIDGDTLVCNLDLGWGIWHMGARVRLARVNCPELSTEGGAPAKEYTERVLTDTVAHGKDVLPRVTIVSTRLDNYGRTLAEVLLPDGGTLSDLLLSSGHAAPM